MPEPDPAAGATQSPGPRGPWLGLIPVLLLPVVLLAPALRPGYVLSSADTLLESYLLNAPRPPGFAPRNPLLGDSVSMFIPWRRLVSDELRAGRLPFWNPHAFAGSPLLGNSQSAVFDPLSLPYLLVGEPSRATVWVALLRMWLAGVGAWLLACRLGASPWAASVSGVIYGCGGSTLVWLLYPVSSSSAWFPWILLAGEWLASGGGARAVASLALALAGSALGGQEEVAFFAAIAASLYVLARRGQLSGWNPPAVARIATGLVAVGVLAFALAAVHVLPFLDALPQASLPAGRLALRQAQPVWPYPMVDRAVLQVFPYLFGRPVAGEIDLAGAYTNFCEQSGSYASLLGLGLAVVGLSAALRRSPWRVLAGLGLLAWLYGINFPPFPAATRHLPVLDVAPAQRAMFVTLLAVALLAAAGLDALASGIRRAIMSARIAAAVLVILAALGTVAGVWMLQGAPSYMDLLRTVARHPHVAVWFSGKQDVLIHHFGELAPNLARLYVLPWTALAIASAAALFAARRFGRALPFAATVVVAADLLLFGHGYNPAIPEAEAYPASSRLDEIRRCAGDGRILVLDWGLPPNVATYYGLDDVLGYDAIGHTRIERLLAHACAFPAGPVHFRLATFDCASSPVLDLLSVRTVVSARPLTGTPLVRQPSNGPGFVYLNPHAYPRAFVPDRVVAVRDLGAVEAEVRRAPPDPRTTAIIEAKASASVAAGRGEVRWRRPTPEAISLDAAMDRGGTVLVSESYDPGWRASVDGSPTAVQAADLALMAVQVPAGRHRVELRFAPQHWRVAVALSAAGLIAATVLLCGPRRRTQNTT